MLFAAHLAARAIDVDLHVFLVLGVQVEHGGNQLIAQLLVHRLAKEDDTLSVLETIRNPLFMTDDFENQRVRAMCAMTL